MHNIYMNEHIRDKKPAAPVIVVEDPKRGGKRVFSNHVEIWHDGYLIATVLYDPKHNPSSTHDVKAWVEVSDDATIEVL